MRAYLYLITTFAGFFMFSRPALIAHIDDPIALIFLAVAAIFIGSFAVFYLSDATRIPSFVIAIGIGIMLSPLLQPLTNTSDLLTVLVSASATLILFSGGLEMPFGRFRKIAAPVLLLSSVGVLSSTILFGYTLFALSPLFSISMSFGLAVLLGAILASTDPTVLIPLMKQLRFQTHKMKDLIIAESAVTDVTGTLFTLLVLDILLHEGLDISAPSLIQHLFSREVFFSLLEHSLIGIVFGFLGVCFLILLAKLKTQDSREHDVDAAFFLFVPLAIFALTNVAGGSGFLAAFIAGLLFSGTQYLHETERFFNHIVDGFVKPSVFIFLGAIVPIETLLQYAPLGILISFLFIFVIRPVIVLISLIPIQFSASQRLSFKEILGLAIVRETGAVPAVLIMSLLAIPSVGTPAFLAIGLWVIITTVMILPAITPFIFGKLGIAESIPVEIGADLHTQRESFVILATRGHSFARRLPQIESWALEHNLHRICVLLCLEDRYSEDSVAQYRKDIETLFSERRSIYTQEGKKVEYFLVTTPGYLHDAIRSVPEKTTHAVSVFVGKRMLDFHLAEVQNLGIPLFFID